MLIHVKERHANKLSLPLPLNLSLTQTGPVTLALAVAVGQSLSILTDHLQGVVPLMIDSCYVRLKSKPQHF